jgi:putative transcriptional regulator
MPRLRCLLKEFVDESDLTQSDVAKETGLSKNTIGDYYNDRILRIDEKTAIALCVYFKCELGEMFVIDWGRPDRD